MANVNTNTFSREGANLITNILIRKKFSETVIMNMLEFLTNNICVMFDGRVLQ